MELQVLLTGIIALCTVLSALGFVFHLLLNPVKGDVADLKNDVSDLKEAISELKSGQQALESGQRALESGQRALNTKMDQLLSK